MRSKKRRGNSRAWGLPVVLVIGMVLAAVAGFVFVLQVLLPTASGAEPANNVKALGSPDAPVTMVVYSDFQ